MSNLWLIFFNFKLNYKNDSSFFYTLIIIFLTQYNSQNHIFTSLKLIPFIL